jgi:hypothetical protein
MKSTQEQIILVPANQTDPSITDYPGFGLLSPTILLNGGITVVAIIAMGYFCKTLLKSIADLLEVWNKKCN